MLNLFTKKSIGLDIADNSIEAVELIKQKNKTIINSIGRIKIAPGIVEKGMIKSQPKLAKAIDELFKNAKPKPINRINEVIFGLPESQVYTHTFYFNEEVDKNLERVIQNEIKQNIPVKFEDLRYAYKILAEGKKEKMITIIAAKKNVIAEWVQFFESIELKVELFDVETLANFRNIDVYIKNKPICIVDIGSSTTNISIFSKRGLIYNNAIFVAGNDLTKKISEVLRVNFKEAEEIKKKLGLCNPEKKAYNALASTLDPVLKEINLTIKYIKSKYNKEVEEVIIIGGTAKLKGLIRYLQTGIDPTVRLGGSKLLAGKISIKYIEAIGLALRGLEKHWEEKDPAFYLNKKIKEEKIEKTEQSEKLKINNDELVDNLDDEEPVYNLKKRLKILYIIIFIGFVSIFGAYYFRKYEKEKNINEIQKKLNQNIEQFDVSKTEVEDKKNTVEDFIFSEKEVAETDDDFSAFSETEISTTTEEEQAGELVFDEYVEIKNTETGWLNVRENPGMAYAIVAKIYPGESYRYIGLENDWYQIELNDKKMGWINKKYGELIEK